MFDFFNTNVRTPNPGPQVFGQSYRVFSGAFSDTPSIDEGGKVILPPSALQRISMMNISWPLMLRIQNPVTKLKTHGGVLQFTAEEGRCYMPLWMMDFLGLKPNALVDIRTVALRKGAYLKIRPQTKDFIELSNPKAILERKLRDFACMTKGDTIAIHYNNKQYLIDVREVRDKTSEVEAISIIETDVNLEFERPLDMPPSPETTQMKDDPFEKQQQKKRATNTSNPNDSSLFMEQSSDEEDEEESLNMGEEQQDETKKPNYFTGVGYTIGGKRISTPQTPQTTQKDTNKASTTSNANTTKTKEEKKGNSKEDYWASLASKSKGRTLGGN